ncbi:winged helix-turn-helix transcriptional regulator [Acidimicrobiaceae bacterium AH-315-P05]|nr:winged helix-turn-helix transcriptional regulator [Acidimicrobiaceae bacterium AH-315-P05]
MQHRAAESLSASMYEQCLGNRVARLHRVIARRFDQALRPLGLSLPQIEVLAVLMMRGSVAPAVIADALAIERSTVSRNVSLLERNGWVEIDAAPSGRTRTVSITIQGMDKLGSADLAWAEAQAAVTDTLGSDAIATLDEWLDRLIFNGN